MFAFLLRLFRLVSLFTRGHKTLVFENLALRQQLTVYKRQQKRPRCTRRDRLSGSPWPDIGEAGGDRYSSFMLTLWCAGGEIGSAGIGHDSIGTNAAPRECERALMIVLNRSAILVKPKQPFPDWLNAADPTSRELTQPDLLREPRIYLIPECNSTQMSTKSCETCARRF